MARKSVIYSYQFFDNQSVSADATSEATNVVQLDAASIDLRWSGGPLVGTVQVQVKNGENADWRDIEFSSPIAVSGASGQHEIIFLTMPFTEMRLFFDYTSGSGNLDAVITAKSLGA